MSRYSFHAKKLQESMARAELLESRNRETPLNNKLREQCNAFERKWKEELNAKTNEHQSEIERMERKATRNLL
jgi:hypothetical protein